MACLRRYPVKATNSSRILIRSPNPELRYRTCNAATNSLRVVMLICLVTLCCSRRTIRRVANYVRQQGSTSCNSDESMRTREDGARHLGKSHGALCKGVGMKYAWTELPSRQ